MKTQELAALEQQYKDVHTLACDVTKAHGALTAKSGKGEEAAAAQLAYEQAMAQLRERVLSYTVETVGEAALYFQICVFEKALTRLGSKTEWDPGKSFFLTHALISLKNAFVTKTEEEARNDGRVRLLNSRIRSTLAFIKACQEAHYTPEYGLNPRAVREVCAKLTSEINHCNVNDSLAVRVRGKGLQELLRKMESSVPHDWLKESRFQRPTPPPPGSGFNVAKTTGYTPPEPTPQELATEKPKRPSRRRRE